jgi:hypothetical protein
MKITRKQRKAILKQLDGGDASCLVIELELGCKARNDYAAFSNANISSEGFNGYDSTIWWNIQPEDRIAIRKARAKAWFRAVKKGETK